jgi:hypothetical protein
MCIRHMQHVIEMQILIGRYDCVVNIIEITLTLRILQEMVSLNYRYLIITAKKAVFNVLYRFQIKPY